MSKIFYHFGESSTEFNGPPASVLNPANREGFKDLIATGHKIIINGQRVKPEDFWLQNPEKVKP